MLNIVTSDGQRLALERDVAEQAGLLRDFAQNQTDEDVPVPTITSGIFRKILDYFEHYGNEPVDAGTRRRDQQWEREYLAIDHGTLFNIITAANYLGAKPLLSMCTQEVADRIVGKTPQEIRQMFNIQNNSSPGQPTECPAECPTPDK